jgi:hypothetical protein
MLYPITGIEAGWLLAKYLLLLYVARQSLESIHDGGISP